MWFETILGKDAFKKLFPVILTDGGSEFSSREEMEEFCEPKAQPSFTATLTVSGKRNPARRTMSIYAILSPKAVPLLI